MLPHKKKIKNDLAYHLFGDDEIEIADELYEPDPTYDSNEFNENIAERENVEGVDYDKRQVEIFDTLGIFGIIFIIIITNVTLIIMGKVDEIPMPDRYFGLYITLFFGIFTLTALIGGSLVTYCGVDVMYTRKFIHFFSFFLPFGLFQLVPFEKSITTYLLTFCATFVAYMPLIEGVRNLSFMGFSRIAFSAFDRKQDRPLTLLWAVSQSLSGYISLLPTAVILEQIFKAGKYVMLPLFTVAIGDGLAEIIGRKLGRHKYRTRAMCTRKAYTRSIEGSLCVFITCIITIAILYKTQDQWNWVQFIVAEITIPIIMTIVEAYAPHSWDNAFLLGVGGILTVGIFCMGELFV